MVSKKLELGSVSYTIGIMSIVFGVISDFGLGGIILGILGLRLNRDTKNPYYAQARKLNKLGIIVGVVIFVISILSMYYFLPELGLQ